MKIRTLIIAALLSLSLQAAADLVLVARAHEVPLRDLRLPGSTSGTLSFKACETCEYMTVRVTSATRYEANDQDMDLEAFRRELERLATSREGTATVLHHLGSNAIEAVRVSF